MLKKILEIENIKVLSRIEKTSIIGGYAPSLSYGMAAPCEDNCTSAADCGHLLCHTKSHLRCGTFVCKYADGSSGTKQNCSC